MPGQASRQQQAPKSAPRQQRQQRRQRWERQCERARCRWLLSPRSISDNEAGGRGEHVGANLFVRSRFVSLPLPLSLSTALSIISYWKQKWSTLRCVERERAKESGEQAAICRSLEWVALPLLLLLPCICLVCCAATALLLPALFAKQCVCKPARQLSLRSSAVAASPSWGKMLQGFVSG